MSSSIAGRSHLPNLAIMLGGSYLLTHVIAKLMFFPGYYLGNDSPTFITPAISFAESFIFFEMIFRPPVYPIFLAAHRALFGAENWLVWACYSQIACLSVAIAIFASILKAEGARRRVIIAFGAIMTLYPANFFYENRIMSEAPAFLWIAVLTWSGWKAHRNYGTANVLIVGLVAGIGPMLRPEYLIISLFVVVYFALVRACKKIDLNLGAGAFLAALAVVPSLLWAFRNLAIYSFFGLTVAVGGALIFHTYSHLEVGRTSYNAPAVDRVLERLKLEYGPNVVFDAEPKDAPVATRVAFWKQISNATMLTVLARPFDYAKSVGGAVIGMAHPALGRQQLDEFFGLGPLEFRIYQLAHVLLFAFVAFFVIHVVVRKIAGIRERAFSELFILFIVGAVISDLLFTALLINGPNNRYRMPFDGVIVLTGLLACVSHRQERTHAI